MTVCPRCGAVVAPGDRFCADCGARIAAPDPPAASGFAEAIGPDIAARTDAGRVHPTNQDAFAISGPASGGGVLVVCDGVSNAQTPELAAATAARVAHAALAASADAAAARPAAMRAAIRRAHEAVCALPFDRRAALDPPATTIVAAWLHADGATLGWLGDSRGYLLAPGGGRLLTRDHSWLTMVVERGELTAAQARRDERAHALTHCLGTTEFARASPCPEPAIATVARAEGWLLLCSDGLWNYAETPGELRGAAGGGLDADAAALCAHLIAFARARGGHDNVTVAVARWG